MQLHPFRVEPDDDGSLRIVSQYGVLLGQVWRRTEGDLLAEKPYGAAVGLEDDEEDGTLWGIAVCATEEEAMEAVIRWHVELSR